MIRGVTRRILGSLSNDDGDVNKNSKKAIGLDWQTTTLHVYHAFLYISLPSLHYYDVTQDHDFLFLLLNFYTIFKNWSPEKNYQHLTNWTRWNKRDKVKSSATSLLEWRFRIRRRRCCLSSLLPHLSGVPHLHVNRLLGSVAGHNAGKPKEES